MDIETLLPAGGLDALAQQLGLPREQAKRGAEALLPSIAAGLGNRAGGPQAPNASALEAELAALGGPDLAHNVVGPQPTDLSKGNQLLGNIFGSKDVSRQVADDASKSTGLDPAILKKMLPILAMLLAGHMAKRSAGQGGIGGILGSVLSAAGGSGASGGLGGMLGSILGGAR